MKSSNTKVILVACLMLVLGFAAGFLFKQSDQKNHLLSAGNTSVSLPVQKVNDSTASLPFGDRVEPNLWRLSVDPFWVPSFSPVIPLPVPSVANFPLQVPDIKTSVGDKDVRVIVNVPGLTEKDVDIKVGTDRVTIKGEKSEEKSDHGKTVQAVHQAFEESISLPCKVDGGQAKASLKDGVLTVSIPKAAGGIAQGANKSWH